MDWIWIAYGLWIGYGFMDVLGWRCESGIGSQDLCSKKGSCQRIWICDTRILDWEDISSNFKSDAIRTRFILIDISIGLGFGICTKGLSLCGLDFLDKRISDLILDARFMDSWIFLDRDSPLDRI